MTLAADYDLDNGNRQLLIQIIARAVQDSRGYVSSLHHGGSVAAVAKEARAWLDEKGGWFDLYCELLGINRETISSASAVDLEAAIAYALPNARPTAEIDRTKFLAKRRRHQTRRRERIKERAACQI